MAPWLKEPGVLLAAPAVWVALEDRQLRIAALAPVFGLASWALVRGGLARPERLPSSWLAYLSDLGDVVHILVVDQGRWLLLAGLLVAWVVTRKMGRELARPRVRAPWAILVVFVGTWGLFFAAVGFFANRGALEAHTHVRYLLPAMAVLAVSLAARVPRNWIPVLVLPGLFWLHERSTYGPEASCFGVDAAIAEQEAASWIAEQDHPVWVGTYQSVGLTQPWVGIVDRPVEGLHVYRYGTDPESIGSGSIVVKAAYGEPTGTIERGIRLSELRRWTHHEATVVAWKVR
jgi:hypothetical protein